MLTSKKVGDTLYIVFMVSKTPAREEVVSSVGRLFIKTEQGNSYCRKTGVEHKQNRRRDFVPTCKAWPSKDAYDLAVAHYIEARTTLRALEVVNPGNICVEDLKLLKAILKRSKG